MSANNYSLLLLIKKPIKIICPGLHHPSTVVKVLRVVVSALDTVAFGVSELPLNGIRRPSLFVQGGGSHCPEAMTAHLIFSKSHSSECSQNGVIAHRSGIGSNTRENIFPSACELVQFFQYFNGLAG